MGSAFWRALLAHVQTWRPYTLAYPGLVGLAGAALAPGRSSWLLFIVAWAAATLGWIASHYLGDYFDRDLDALSKPQRPIPSGRMSPKTALFTGTSCALITVIAVLVINWRVALLAIVGLAGAVAYSLLLKGCGISGNLVRGSVTAIAFICGAMMTSPYPSLPVLLLSVTFLVHDTASNLVGTLRDVVGDGKAGYRTFPVRHGLVKASFLAAGLYVAAVGNAFFVTALLPADKGSYLLLLGAASVLGVAAFWPLLAGSAPVSPPVALSAHRMLVLERLVLASAVLAAGTGVLMALALLLPLLAFSVVTQARMRTKYEFSPSSA
jgi:geranylgeranylglycerol-phosphate geranylgeranyltransferase